MTDVCFKKLSHHLRCLLQVIIGIHVVTAQWVSETVSETRAPLWAARSLNECCSTSKWVGGNTEASDASRMTRGSFPKALVNFKGRRDGLWKRGAANIS